MYFFSGSVAAERIDGISHRTIIYLQDDTAGIPKNYASEYLPGFKEVEEIPEKPAELIYSVTKTRDLIESYPPPDISYLSYFGRGLSKQQANEVQQSKLALILDFAYPEKHMIDGLKQSNNYVYQLAKSVNGYLWDSETRELFTPDVWKEQRLDAWFNDIPIVEKHIVIHAYKNTEYVRAITLGMAKFGFPDIVVNDFSWSSNRSMGNLINVVSQSLVEGNFPDKNGKIQINIKELSETPFKIEMVDSLIENAVSVVTLDTAAATWEDGDPYNYLMELKFDEGEGATLQEKQNVVLSSIFGWEDTISYVKHNQLIEEASRKAREQLEKLKTDFTAGLSPGEFIQVKAPFETPDGGSEWMWVEILSWDGDKIRGLLKNEPYNIPNLKGGAEVIVVQGDVFDYMRQHPDGSSEGNETAELIMKYQAN